MAWLPVTQVSDLGGATPRRYPGRLAVGRDYTVNVRARKSTQGRRGAAGPGQK